MPAISLFPERLCPSAAYFTTFVKLRPTAYVSCTCFWTFLTPPPPISNDGTPDPINAPPTIFVRSPDGQAKKELAAIMIQSNLRRFFAQMELTELQSLRDEALAREKERQAAAVIIQSVARMREGR